MQKVLLEPLNPNDLTVDELTAFARTLKPDSDEVKVVVGHEEQRGAGVTMWDVLHFWVPGPEFVRDAIYGYLIAECLAFMKNRRNRKHSAKRPISIVVLLPDGTEVDKIVDKVGESQQEPDSQDEVPQLRRLPTHEIDPTDETEGK